MLLLVVVGAESEAGGGGRLLGLSAEREAGGRLLLLLGLTKEAAGMGLCLLLAKETASRRRSAKAGGGGLGTKEATGWLLGVLLSEETARLLLLLGLTEETAGGAGRRGTEACGGLLGLTKGAGGVAGGTKAEAGGRSAGGARTRVALGSALLVVHETQLFDEAKTVNRSRRGFGLGEFDVLLFVSEEDLDLVLLFSDAPSSLLALPVFLPAVLGGLAAPLLEVSPEGVDEIARFIVEKGGLSA